MEGLKKEDFTYSVNAEGYMVYYKGIGIGGAGIKGKFSGRGRTKQMEDYKEMANRDIDSYLKGYMPTYVRETIKNINIVKEQNKTV